jgi:hypothetical protein
LRWVTGVAVVVVLAGAVILLANRGEDPVTPTSTSVVVTMTTSSASSTSAVATTTTTEEQRLVEVEELLRDLWFGWFDAIYRKDANALWQVVATEALHGAAVEAMTSLAFVAPPAKASILLRDLDVLLDRTDCLVVHYRMDARLFLAESESQFVSVMWPDDRYGLRFATAWQFPDDLWQMDCDDLVREETP